MFVIVLFYDKSPVCSVQAVQAFVRQAMGYVEQTPNAETKVELIKTLQSVTEGKVCTKTIMHGIQPCHACRLT